MDWAELVTVDLSQLDTPEGKKQQADILISAVREKGFFYVKNFGISQGRVDRQFALGKTFYELPLEEKLKYTPQGLGSLLRLDSGAVSYADGVSRRGAIQRICACWAQDVRGHPPQL